MQSTLSRVILSTVLLTAAPAAWAHAAFFNGDLLANLAHLLTQADHLLLLAGIGVAAGIAAYIRNKSSLRGGDDDHNH